ncbi:MAG: ArgR family transcriptional regulator [Tannerella sp.]|jgi:transcriptional regulator of arginine metabolism|nr:ArgR family transcriptional regulator [Tannerella sp.]
MKNVKKQRLTVIENIICTKIVRNQDDLQKLLTDKGFEVTQATLSRDIKRLKIVKIHDGEDRYVYVLPDMAMQKQRLPTVMTERPASVLLGKSTVEFSGNLAVIKTPPGYAMGIASEIDKHAPEEILGTIAGDDTILIIPCERYTRTQVRNALERFLSD